MPKSNFTAKTYLSYLFLNQKNPEIEKCDCFYLSLHNITDRDSKIENQNDNEIFYKNYERQKISRNNSKWKLAENRIFNIETIKFPEIHQDTLYISHFCLGLYPFGPGPILYIGELNEPVVLQYSTPAIIRGNITFEEY